MKQQSRYIPILLSLGLLLVTAGVYMFFSKPFARYLSSYKITYYQYKMPRDFASYVPENLTPATAVPVLMYHGITNKPDTENTSLKNFVKTMELLKKNGFQTISTEELFLFKKGLFVLPSKPILITFDDGRKDSYYPTDDVFKKLGFKATIFVATGPLLDKNNFYLTKEELATMSQSGRWDIQAHGRYSHKHIRISEDPTLEEGRYLSSKIYIPEEHRFETDSEFIKRITEDYSNGDFDIKEITGVTPQYFAIPLNDYGEYPVSNFPESKNINNSIVTKRYKLAFVQSNENVDTSKIVATPYNLKDEPSFSIRRLEVKNMTPEEVLAILEDYVPGNPNRIFDSTALRRLAQQHLSGTISVLDDGYDLTADEPGMNALVIMGEPFWRDYTAHASFSSKNAETSGVIARYTDDNNYVICGISDGTPFLKEKVKGVIYTRAIGKEKFSVQENISMDITAIDQKVSCSINNISVAISTQIFQKQGFAGIKAWDKDEEANLIIHDFRVKN